MWQNFILFLAWMLLFQPLLMIAEYFSVKAGHKKMNKTSDMTAGLCYVFVGCLLFIIGCFMCALN